jgi:hypothetical protein
MKTPYSSTDQDVRMKATLIPARNFASASHSGDTDVSITLWVPDICVPPLAQQGAHEDCHDPRWAMRRLQQRRLKR